MESGIKVAISVQGSSSGYEASYYFPRVPVVGEHLHFMRMSGADPLDLGDEVDAVVTRVTYAVVEGEPNSSGMEREASVGHVGKVLIEVLPIVEEL